MIRWKCFVTVPQLYQFRGDISGGPAIKYFYMIHRGGRALEFFMPDSRISSNLFVLANDFKWLVTTNCLWVKIVYDSKLFMTSICIWLRIVHVNLRSLTYKRDWKLSNWSWLTLANHSDCLCSWLRIVHDNSRSLLCKRDQQIWNCSCQTLANHSDCLCSWLRIVHDNSRSLLCKRDQQIWNCSCQTLANYSGCFVYDFEFFMTTPGLFCAKETGICRIVHARLSRIIRAHFVYDFDWFMTTPSLLCTKETGISRITWPLQVSYIQKRPEVLELFMSDSRIIQAVFVHDFELFMTTPGRFCAIDWLMLFLLPRKK